MGVTGSPGQRDRGRPRTVPNPRRTLVLLDLPGHVFVVPGDLTQLRADVVVYPTSTALRGEGHLYAPFADA